MQERETKKKQEEQLVKRLHVLRAEVQEHYRLDAEIGEYKKFFAEYEKGKATEDAKQNKKQKLDSCAIGLEISENSEKKDVII